MSILDALAQLPDDAVFTWYPLLHTRGALFGTSLVGQMAPRHRKVPVAEPRPSPAAPGIIFWRAALKCIQDSAEQLELAIANARIGADQTEQRLAVARTLREAADQLDPPAGQGRLL